MYLIKSFVNTPIDSVTYLIVNTELKKVLIIDPGTDKDDRILEYLKKNNLMVEYVFLTHEHFDHILGVNFLREQFSDIKVVSSRKTSERLSNPKKNLAIFHNQLDLRVEASEILIEAGALDIIGLQFEVFQTLGHTDSSLSLKLDDLFFSGDFLLRGTRIVTNLPTGSKVQYQQSIDKYSEMLQGMSIYPGHGEPYIYKKV